MTHSSSPCPEALYGQHGEANSSGKCPYCGTHLGKSWSPGRTRQSLSDDEFAYQTSWHKRLPNYDDQDPLMLDPDTDDFIYD